MTPDQSAQRDCFQADSDEETILNIQMENPKGTPVEQMH